jgi:hypothetical protein
MRTLTVSIVKNGRFEFEEVLDANAEGGEADGQPTGADATDGAAPAEAAR